MLMMGVVHEDYLPINAVHVATDSPSERHELNWYVLITTTITITQKVPI